METPPTSQQPTQCNIEQDSPTSTPSTTLRLTQEVFEIINSQNTSGEPKRLKEAALVKLDNIIRHLAQHEMEPESQTQTANINTTKPAETSKNHASDDAVATIITATYTKMETIVKEMAEMRREMQTKMDSMEKELVETRKEMAELKSILTSKNTNASKVWNHVSPQVLEPPPNNPRKLHHRKVIPEKDDKLKQNQQKTTIKLTMTKPDNETKCRLTETPGKEITKILQEAINKEYHDKTNVCPRVCGFDTLSSDAIRIQCYDEKSATALKESMDWSKIGNGVEAHLTKYGIVIRHVDKGDIEPNNAVTYHQQIQTLQEENERWDLNIVQILPLRRRPNEAAKHHSIVIFTDSPQEADDCIEKGIIVNGRFHKAEWYNPQLNITQCYKCYAFGHTATHCKDLQRCGKCGDTKHETTACTKETPECHNCQGPYPSWHIHCPKRDEASKKLVGVWMRDMDACGIHACGLHACGNLPDAV